MSTPRTPQNSPTSALDAATGGSLETGPVAPAGGPATARTGVATGAAARSDGASPEGKKYVVAAHKALGYRRGGHTFGNTKAVYLLSDKLAARLREDGLVHISPYNAERDADATLGSTDVLTMPDERPAGG